MAHQGILGTVDNSSSPSGVAAGLNTSGSLEPESLGFLSKGRTNQKISNLGSSSRIDKTKLKCDHCGMTRHTKSQCFQLVGYPEWWNDGHKKGNKEGGKASATIGKTGEPDHRGGGEQKGTAFGGFTSAGDNAENGEGGKGFGTLFSSPHSIAFNTFNYPFIDFSTFDYDISKITKASLEENVYYDTGQNFLIEKNKPFYQTNLSRKGTNWKKGKRGTIRFNKNCGQVNIAQNCEKLDHSWIFDCGATDTMTFDVADIISQSKPRVNYIKTANGGGAPVKRGGTIEISPTLKLSNCLYVPSLSHKLLSISHVTKELNCTVLMHPTFCILQDIRTGAIIGHGTERRGLYYVEEVTQHGNVMLAHGTTDREAWLWHRRLGHPSIDYLHLLFPKLFPSKKTFKL
ncbi:putative transcription factor interactor and regulator CCHC(Zn) family [Helianthus annuus]|nr:putative transcription factor interactor and regulator CCHC(Zn) family [Helianthus annuus]